MMGQSGARTATAVLISGRGSNLQALMDAAAAPDYPARIALVLADNPGAAGLDRARDARIPTHVIDPQQHAGRPAFDRALEQALAAHDVGIVCLAGFMRILGPAFVRRRAGRILNIHPSLLPAHKGLDTHRRALAAGAQLHGCSVHMVTPALDAGPVIMQAQVRVRPEDTAQSLAARVLAREHEIYPRALALAATGRLWIEGGKLLIDGTDAGPIIHGPVDFP